MEGGARWGNTVGCGYGWGWDEDDRKEGEENGRTEGGGRLKATISRYHKYNMYNVARG